MLLDEEECLLEAAKEVPAIRKRERAEAVLVARIPLAHVPGCGSEENVAGPLKHSSSKQMKQLKKQNNFLIPQQTLCRRDRPRRGTRRMRKSLRRQPALPSVEIVVFTPCSTIANYCLSLVLLLPQVILHQLTRAGTMDAEAEV